jgi:hypothetical protein
MSDFRPPTELARILDAMPQAMAFVFIGVLTAIGQILQSTSPITWRIAVGRCITTGGIAIVAGAALAIFPDLPLIAQLGIAAALASLGSSGIEVVLQKVLNR